MKSIINYITESSENKSNIGNKIMGIFNKDESDFVVAILKRTKNWDENKFSWSRDPMFLVASAGSKPHFESGERVRNLQWVRQKFFDTSLDAEGVQGTLSNYNVANDEGLVPLSVLGIYFDRQFLPITSIETYNKIKELIEKQ